MQEASMLLTYTVLRMTRACVYACVRGGGGSREEEGERERERERERVRERERERV
jgi:iron only hydrogenase large subunit-like protein